MAHRFLHFLLISFFSAAIIAISFASPTFAGKRPLSFIENRGQVTDQYGNTHRDIDFKLPAANGLNLFIGKGALHYQWIKAGGQPAQTMIKDQGKATAAAHELYRMDVQLIGANPNAVLEAADTASYMERFYLPSVGSDGAIAHSFKKIIYHNIYPNIDWVFYFNTEGKLEHDFIVHPGGRPTDIKLQYGGAVDLQIMADGSLFAATTLGSVSEKVPYAYEAKSNRMVKSAFILNGNSLSFSTAPFKGTLVIDPILDWGTYFGGTDVDAVYDNTVGKDGMIYTTGGTSSTGNIATTGAYQTSFAGGSAYFNDAFISKFDPSGNCLWSTYYGTADEDISKSISRDTAGNLYIAGYTSSTTGLASTGAFQSTNGGGYDAFIAGFDTSGQRLWGSYYGGSGDDGGYGPVALNCDRMGNIYLCGQTSSTTGIATTGAYQPALYAGAGDQDGFLAKFNTSGTLQWGTYFGGNLGDAAYGVTNDTLGNIYITGNTNSTSGIASIGQTTNAGSYDAFVAKFSPAGTKLWSTYFGGNLDEYATSIACDGAANVYLTGLTTSSTGLSTTGAHQTVYGGGYQDAMLAKFSSVGALQWATYYGGSSEDQGDKVICAANGGIYISGFTGSDTGMIAGAAFQTALGGAYDGLLARFNNMGGLVWGTYLGGVDADEAFCVAADPSFNLYTGGNTTSSTGIATPGSWQGAYGGGDYDAFLMRFKDCAPPLAPDTIFGAVAICAGTTNAYNVSPVTNATSYLWALPNGWTGSSLTTVINATNNGNSGTIKVMAANDCSNSDTAALAITVDPLPAMPQILRTGNVLSTSQSYSSYQWNKDGQPISGATNPTYSLTGSGSYTVTVTNSAGCSITSAAINLNVTATNELLSQNGITVYPNPASSYINIEIPVKAFASLFNIEGRLLTTVALKSGNNTIDIAGFTSGIYLLRFSDNKGNLLGSYKISKD